MSDVGSFAIWCSEKQKEKMGVMNGEVELNVPASKAWEIFKTNELIKKVNPNLLADAKYVQGDGSPGSVRLFKLGPGKLFLCLC